VGIIKDWLSWITPIWDFGGTKRIWLMASKLGDNPDFRKWLILEGKNSGGIIGEARFQN